MLYLTFYALKNCQRTTCARVVAPKLRRCRFSAENRYQHSALITHSTRFFTASAYVHPLLNLGTSLYHHNRLHLITQLTHLNQHLPTALRISNKSPQTRLRTSLYHPNCLRFPQQTRPNRYPQTALRIPNDPPQTRSRIPLPKRLLRPKSPKQLHKQVPINVQRKLQLLSCFILYHIAKPPQDFC